MRCSPVRQRYDIVSDSSNSNSYYYLYCATISCVVAHRPLAEYYFVNWVLSTFSNTESEYFLTEFEYEYFFYWVHWVLSTFSILSTEYWVFPILSWSPSSGRSRREREGGSVEDRKYVMTLCRRRSLWHIHEGLYPTAHPKIPSSSRGRWSLLL